jgi:hypothetical protein
MVALPVVVAVDAADEDDDDDFELLQATAVTVRAARPTAARRLRRGIELDRIEGFLQLFVGIGTVWRSKRSRYEPSLQARNAQFHQQRETEHQE